jgi:hypothetical protein
VAPDSTSRYRTDPAVSGPDARGRVTLAVDPRPLPVLPGSYLHVLADGDRADGLADKYYGDPLLWWQICDANPDFLSPCALLGQEPVITAGFSLTPTDGAADRESLWRTLFARLSVLPGIERVSLESDDDLRRPVGHHIRITYNRLAVAEPLTRLLAEIGFTVEAATESTRAGQPIVIPPAGSG